MENKKTWLYLFAGLMVIGLAFGITEIKERVTGTIDVDIEQNTKNAYNLDAQALAAKGATTYEREYKRQQQQQIEEQLYILIADGKHQEILNCFATIK